MGIITGLALYFLIWWTALFVVLPFGVRPHEKLGPATAGGAPENPCLKKKIAVTTLLSAVLWLLLYGAIRLGLLDFVGVSETMLAEDGAR